MGGRVARGDGLSIVQEGHERLYMTCLQTHRVVNTLWMARNWPNGFGPSKAGNTRKKPSIGPRGRCIFPVVVLCSMGTVGITSRSTEPTGIHRDFGGAEGGIAHWGPHGGMIDLSANGEETLLLAMSDQQLLRLSRSGEVLGKVTLPEQVIAADPANGGTITSSRIWATSGRRTGIRAGLCRFWTNNCGWSRISGNETGVRRGRRPCSDGARWGGVYAPARFGCGRRREFVRSPIFVRENGSDQTGASVRRGIVPWGTSKGPRWLRRTMWFLSFALVFF